MPPFRPPTEKDIWTITRRTIGIIRSNVSKNVCLFGSAGTALWTNIGRVPNDIDIVVSKEDWEHFDEEDIKHKIEVADHRYFREQSALPEATHHILYCRLPGWRNDHGRRVKIDILVPPTIGLPKIPASKAIRIKGIPVMPIFDLLVMRTAGWWERRNSDRKDFNAKVKNDVREILALLVRARKEGVSYDNEANKLRHTSEFMGRARTLLNSFVDLHGGNRQWKAIQFPVVRKRRALSLKQSGSTHGSARTVFPDPDTASAGQATILSTRFSLVFSYFLWFS